MKTSNYENFRDKRFLILGASHMEEYMVLELQKYGAYVAVTDNNLDFTTSPAKLTANEYWNISWTDIEALASKCLSTGIDGILMGYSEVKVSMAIKLTTALNLPMYCNEYQLEATREKDKFKKLCNKYGIETPEEYDASDDVISFPVIVKPVDSGGSKGIRVCYDKTDLSNAIEYARTYSETKKVVIEEFLTGPEVMLYYTFFDGNIKVTAICDRHVFNQQDDLVKLPVGSTFPSKYCSEILEKYNEKFITMFQKEGFKTGCVFLQGFYINGQLKIYETGYRLNGARENIFVEYFSGFDNLKLLANLSLTGNMCSPGVVYHADPYFDGVGCNMTPILKSGTISKIEGMSKVAGHKNTLKILSDKLEGNIIQDDNIGTLSQVLARIFVVAKNRQELRIAIDEIKSFIKVSDDKGNDMILQMIDSSEICSY